MIPGKPEYHNSYRGELGGQLGVMCVIQIIESIMGSTPLVVYFCDNISALRWASIHPESVTSRWKQANLISCVSDVYHSIESIIPVVHIHVHHNSRNLNASSIPQCTTWRTIIIYHGIIPKLDDTKNHNIGRILWFLWATKRIHSQSPSPLQYCPGYILRNFQSPDTSILCW